MTNKELLWRTFSAVSNVSMSKQRRANRTYRTKRGWETTFFNLLTGVYEPTEGTVSLEVDGQNLNGISALYSSASLEWRVPSKIFVYLKI